MKKIIWVASYPKSGNTWMRYLLGNYFFNKKKKFDPNIISYLKKFYIDNNLIKSDKNRKEIKKTPLHISKYWIQSQENLEIVKGNISFLKTHNALVNINNNEFTNNDLSLAIIYIVRDPRDVSISYSKYRNLNLNETIDFMISKNLVYVKSNNDPIEIEIIGSWAFNYNSWKNGIPQIPRIIVKYEDLLNDCYNVFSEVIEFLSKNMNIKPNYEQVQNSIELSKFENLQKYEKTYSFRENQGGDNFFRTGKHNNWQSELSNEQIKKIEDNFYNEMIELGYI